MSKWRKMLGWCDKVYLWVSNWVWWNQLWNWWVWTRCHLIKVYFIKGDNSVHVYCIIRSDKCLLFQPMSEWWNLLKWWIILRLPMSIWFQWHKLWNWWEILECRYFSLSQLFFERERHGYHFFFSPLECFKVIFILFLDQTSVCSSNPCLNGATCLDGGSYYVCQCPSGYSGTNCEIGRWHIIKTCSLKHIWGGHASSALWSNQNAWPYIHQTLHKNICLSLSPMGASCCLHCKILHDLLVKCVQS